VAGEQHRVGQEGVQRGQVGRAAEGQVTVRLGGHAGRHGRQLHQLRVRRLLAAEHHHRDRAGEQRVQPLGPGATAAEEAHHHEIDAGEQRGQVGHAEAGRVGRPVVRATGAGAEQVGVGRRQQQKHARAPLGVRAPGSSVCGDRSVWLPASRALPGRG
jgi:hypothetical protein